MTQERQQSRGDAREHRRIGREVVAVVVLKSIALAAIWALWFAHPARPDGAGAVARLLAPFATMTSSGTGRDP